ncbi:MAG: subclass B3 metallo-beta-lactamase [Bryobacteraceae bacterium]
MFETGARPVFLLSFLSAALLAQSGSGERAAWNQPVKPFRIIGNVYYAGASGVASYLITTPEGHVLLDGGLPETAPQIEKNVAALGFELKDVKYLLNSHAHFDHAGGLAELKRASGAQMVASRKDGELIEAGRSEMYGDSPDSSFPTVKVDRFVNDGDKVELGGATLTAHLTPGHTKGCTTWATRVSEGGKTYNVVFYCSTTAPGYRLIHNKKYPQMVSDYEHSFAVLLALPCDVFLGPHPTFFHMQEKLARMKKGGPNPFIDSGEMHALVLDSQQDFQRELIRQQGRGVVK